MRVSYALREAMKAKMAEAIALADASGDPVSWLFEAVDILDAARIKRDGPTSSAEPGGRELIGPDEIPPVLRAIAEHVIALAQTVAIATGQHGLTRISLAHDLGRAISVQPGGSVDIMTPSGRVEIYVESCARSEGTAKID